MPCSDLHATEHKIGISRFYAKFYAKFKMNEMPESIGVLQTGNHDSK